MPSDGNLAGVPYFNWHCHFQWNLTTGPIWSLVSFWAIIIPPYICVMAPTTSEGLEMLKKNLELKGISKPFFADGLSGWNIFSQTSHKKLITWEYSHEPHSRNLETLSGSLSFNVWREFLEKFSKSETQWELSQMRSEWWIWNSKIASELLRHNIVQLETHS